MLNDDRDIDHLCTELVAFRRTLHAHPELGFEEHQTAERVVDCLDEAGIEVRRGLAGTGVVGTLTCGDGPTIGLRADLDALPLEEQSQLPHASKHPGKMHACGHDGHTTMLLGAARYLADKGGFAGTVHFIFQPAEENLAGGKRMVDEGLFDCFPMRAVFGLHNWPGLESGVMGVRSGPIMAAADFFELRITGTGGHAAYPHRARDPIVAAAQIIVAWQTAVSRATNPLDSVVLSVTKIHGGTTTNVIPERAVVAGTVRTFRAAAQDTIESTMRQIAASFAGAFGVQVDFDYERTYCATVNSEIETAVAISAMEQTVCKECIRTDIQPTMGAEDFGWMLTQCPGAYALIGNGKSGHHGRSLHNPEYDFNDAIIPIGVRYWVNLVRTALPLTGESPLDTGATEG